VKLSRRNFVAGAGAAVASASAGCDRRGGVGGLTDEWRRFMGHPAPPVLEGALTAPVQPEIDAASHALNRLTFGARPGDYARVAAMGVPAFLEEQLAPEAIEDSQCDRLVRHEFEELEDPVSHVMPAKLGMGNPVERLFPNVKENSGRQVGDLYEFRDKTLLLDLSRATILRAVVSRRQLYERMVQFWSEHFNIDPTKGEAKWLEPADDREVIRKHALGKFADLVRASALSPAMLWYLDGRVNRSHSASEKPNENYARELMELHTLGVHGGYTQQDVMEVARCLTGWTVRDRKHYFKGTVEFKPGQHDDGAKTVLGQTIPAGLGMGDLDRVLGIVTRHPATARHIASKLCQRFIADEPPVSAVEATAAAFTASDGDIKTTLRAMLGKPEFAASAGGKFKRPFHFVVSALRVSNAMTNGGQPIIDALLRMGQAPFRHPTPDGYPEPASHWTGTLIWRWNFAAALAENRLKGTRVEAEALPKRLGGDGALLATCFGRAPTERELAAARQAGTSALAVALASPAFQRC
jgi:uncharacterized protein (DUF1800 family)